jgi:hypothetical protein
MFKDGKLRSGFIGFHREGEFTFQLVLDNSNKVIYESKNIGNTFVKIFQNARENKGIHFDDMMASQVKYEPLYRKVLKRFAVK